jgi:hypothetical protein
MMHPMTAETTPDLPDLAAIPLEGLGGTALADAIRLYRERMAGETLKAFNSSI